MQPLLNAAEPSRRNPGNSRPGQFGPNDSQNFGHKRREDRPDLRYGSNMVAAVDQEQPNAGSSQRPKINGPPWSQNQEGKKPWGQDTQLPATYEAMLDGPCRYHTNDKRGPAHHSTRQCSWYHRTLREGAGAGGNQRVGPPRPPLPKPQQRVALTEANNTPVNRPNQHQQ